MDVNFGEEAPKLGPVSCVIMRVWSYEVLAGGRTTAGDHYRWPPTETVTGLLQI